MASSFLTVQIRPPPRACWTERLISGVSVNNKSMRAVCINVASVPLWA